MKPDYDNWVPNKLKYTLLGITLAFAKMTQWAFMAHKAFSYDGDLQLARKIVEGTADYVKIPDGGTCLDVGCGSGALSIAVAKRNPNGKVIGVDRWGKEYDKFSKKLCERNAEAEGVTNVTFRPGDAMALPFPDETFDAVTSNYVYHNIFLHSKQKLLLETLRTLKKGGTFAIHDLMSPVRYGDMKKFAQKLRDMGYEKVELIDTTDGKFMTKKQSFQYQLQGSTILYGIK